MGNFNITKCLPGFLLALFCVGISGCDLIQQAILSDLPDDADALPVRVTMIYPSDCIGDSGYCDSFHIGVRTAEAEFGISLTEVAGMESDPVSNRNAVKGSRSNLRPRSSGRIPNGGASRECGARLSRHQICNL